MGDVIRLSDYHYPWEEIFREDSGDSTLSIHVNRGTGELEVMIYNDEMECIRKVLSTVDAAALRHVIDKAHRKVGK